MDSCKVAPSPTKAWLSQPEDRRLKAIIRRKKQSTGIRFLSLRFLSERFSAHGPSRCAGDYHIVRRFGWVILTLAFTGVMIWQCVKIVNTYRSYPKITNVEVHEEARPVFPAVTICNHNTLDMTKILRFEEKRNKENISSKSLLPKLVFLNHEILYLEEHLTCQNSFDKLACALVGDDKACQRLNETEGNRTDTVQSAEDYSYNEEYDYYDYPDLNYVESDDIWNLLLLSQADDFSDFRSWIRISESELQTFGYTLSELIVSCSYNGMKCDLKRDFYMMTTEQYGNCYTFNSMLNNRSTIRRSSKSGPEYGLKLVLNTMEDTYLDILAEKVGFRVAVHDPSVIPFVEEIGVDVPSEDKISLAVSMSEYERLGEPHGECSSKEWDYAGDYSIFGCRKICLDDLTLEECGCKIMIDTLRKTQDKGMKEAHLCKSTNKTETDCRRKIQKEYNSGFCSQCSHCIHSCRETQYKVDFSSSHRNKGFNTVRHKILPLRGQHKCRDATHNNRSDSDPFSDDGKVDVHVYIRSKNVQKVIEKPEYTWETLIANLGGIVGLFIGLSLIAIMELLEYLLDVILYFLRINRPSMEEEEEVVIEFTDEFGDLQSESMDHANFDYLQAPPVVLASAAYPLQRANKDNVTWIPSIPPAEIIQPKNVLGRIAKARVQLQPENYYQ